MTDDRDDGLPTIAIREDGAITAVLRVLQQAVLVHPDAARALFQALMREGRLFAQTSEGKHWKERVARSELLSRAMLVAQTTTCWMLEDDREGATPSAVVEAIAAAASLPGRDELIERMLRELDAEVLA